MTSPYPASDDAHSWFGVIALSLAAFIFNTTEFVPVGLLSDIGESFAMRSEHVGLMLTIYAWVVSLTSLPLMLATRMVERRTLLVWVFVVFIASHALAAFAPSFTVLVLARLGVAGAHAVFWSITAALAVRIAPPGRKGQALGMLATGTSLAMVLGIPLGRMVGEQLGWRMTFLLIGLVAVLVLLVLVRLLPHLPSRNSGSLASLPVLLRRPALMGMYALIVLGVTAHFTAYSYVEPFAVRVAQLDGQAVTVALLVLGAAGLLGSVLFGWQGLRRPAAFLLTALAVLALCLLLLQTAAHSQAGLFGLMVVWGTVFMCFGLAVQSRVLGLASDASDVAMSLFSGLFNVGIGAGALLGSQISLHLGVQYVGWGGGLIAVLACLTAATVLVRYRAGFAQGQLSG